MTVDVSYEREALLLCFVLKHVVGWGGWDERYEREWRGWGEEQCGNAARGKFPSLL